MMRWIALLAMIPSIAFADATITNFSTPPLQASGGIIGEQWDDVVISIQGLAALFQAKESTGSEPNDVLNCIDFGRSSQSSTRRNWRICVDASNNLVMQFNLGSDGSPSWITRAEFDQSLGFTSAPAAHVHAAADTTSGQFADARVSQSSVDQWAVSTPAANRVVKGNVSAQIDAGWISASGVTQHEAELEISAAQVTSGVFPNSRIPESAITQYGYLLKSGDAFIRTSGNCPSGTTEATSARAMQLWGADTAADDVQIPDSAGVRCALGSAPSGCGAPDSSNYSQFISESEMPLHNHTGPSHSHTTGVPNHSHSLSVHTHSIGHTHGVSIGNHSHTFTIGSGADTTSGNNVSVKVGVAGSLGQTGTAGSTSVTSGGASTSTSGSGGGGGTGSGGGGTFGSSVSGTGNTGSTGGTQPFIGPVFTIKICVVN